MAEGSEAANKQTPKPKTKKMYRTTKHAFHCHKKNSKPRYKKSSQASTMAKLFATTAMLATCMTATPVHGYGFGGAGFPGSMNPFSRFQRQRKRPQTHTQGKNPFDLLSSAFDIPTASAGSNNQKAFQPGQGVPMAAWIPDGFGFGPTSDPFQMAAWVPSNAHARIFGDAPTALGRIGNSIDQAHGAAKGLTVPDTFNGAVQAQNSIAPKDSMAATLAAPTRRFATKTDPASGDIVIFVSAPDATGDSFDIQVDEADRVVRIQEKWAREFVDEPEAEGQSNETPGTPFYKRRGSSSGSFLKSWKVPPTVNLADIRAEYDSSSGSLVVTLPADPNFHQLVDHESRSAIDNSAASDEIVDDSQTQHDAQSERDTQAIREAQAAYEAQAAREAKAMREAKAARQAREEILQKHQAWREQRRQARLAEIKAAQETVSQRQQRRRDASASDELPICTSGTKVKVMYAPNGVFYDAVIRTINPQTGRMEVAWTDEDPTNTVVPAQQPFVRGCNLVVGETATLKDKNSKVRQPDSEMEPLSESSRKIEAVDVNSADDEFEIIDEFFTEDEHESLEKDDDASSGYYMFGEFHPY